MIGEGMAVFVHMIGDPECRSYQIVNCSSSSPDSVYPTYPTQPLNGASQPARLITDRELEQFSEPDTVKLKHS